MIYNMNFLSFSNDTADILENCKDQISQSREKRLDVAVQLSCKKYIHNTVSIERKKKKKTDHKTRNNISTHYDKKTSYLKSM